MVSWSYRKLSDYSSVVILDLNCFGLQVNSLLVSWAVDFPELGWRDRKREPVNTVRLFTQQKTLHVIAEFIHTMLDPKPAYELDVSCSIGVEMNEGETVGDGANLDKERSPNKVIVPVRVVGNKANLRRSKKGTPPQVSPREAESTN